MFQEVCSSAEVCSPFNPLFNSLLICLWIILIGFRKEVKEELPEYVLRRMNERQDYVLLSRWIIGSIGL